MNEKTVNFKQELEERRDRYLSVQKFQFLNFTIFNFGEDKLSFYSMPFQIVYFLYNIYLSVLN